MTKTETFTIERPRTITVTAQSDAAAIEHWKKGLPGHGWQVGRVRVIRRQGTQRTVSGVFVLRKGE